MYLHKPNLETEKATGCWLSSMNFFRGGESIVMQISFIMLLFSDQISGRGKSLHGRGGGGQAVSGHVEESQDEA